MLRNYSQHNALPIFSISFEHSNLFEHDNPGGRSCSRISLMLIFSKEKILEKSEKLRSKTVEELRERKGSKICAMSYLRTYISDLCTCHEKLRAMVAGAILDAEKVITEFSADIGRRAGDAPIFAVETVNPQEGKPLFVGTDLLERYAEVKSKRKPHPFLFRSFISTQIVFSRDTDFGTSTDLWIPK